MSENDGGQWWKTLLTKLIENAPAIVVLMIISYLQQQQIMYLTEQCITRVLGK